MAYSDEYKLGDKVWYETEDGTRNLMVVKELHDSSLALYPFSDTHLTLKDTQSPNTTVLVMTELPRQRPQQIKISSWRGK